MPVLVVLLALAGPLLRYDVKESVTATTPRGRQAQAVVGRVTVAGDRAAWELTAGRFPRSTAQAAISDRSGVTLLDRDEGIYASAGREDFDALFVPRAAPATGASFTPKDVEVSVTPDGAGAPFAGSPTVRFRVEASWRLAIQSPGRAGSVVTKLSGSVLAAPGIEPSPFDDLLRLLPLRGELRDEVAEKLAAVKGLPVKVDLVLESESHGELVGARPGPPDGSTKPPHTVTRIERELSNPERRAARDGDARTFEVPKSFHSRALERLAPADALQ